MAMRARCSRPCASRRNDVSTATAPDHGIICLMRGFSHPLLGEGWRRRLALWGGAVAVALVAIVFAKASDAAFAVFRYCVEAAPWSAWLLTPGVFGLLAWATHGALRPTRGSGIPQVIAALETQDAGSRSATCSLRVSCGKLLPDNPVAARRRLGRPRGPHRARRCQLDVCHRPPFRFHRRASWVISCWPAAPPVSRPRSIRRLPVSSSRSRS